MTVETFASAVSAALGARLVTLLLYGSGARGTNAPDRDVNTLLVCDVVDDDVFAQLESPLSQWAAAGQPPPLIFTAQEWRQSADAFPIEYEDIREAHRLLAGADPWPGIAVDRDDVRRQLERELMGKLIHLRQAYAALRGRPGLLAEVITESASGFFTMLRAALRWSGVAPPAAPAALLQAAAERIGFPAAPLEPLVTHDRGRPIKLSRGDGLPAAYLAAVTRTAEYVNRTTERTRT